MALEQVVVELFVGVFDLVHVALLLADFHGDCVVVEGRYLTTEHLVQMLHHNFKLMIQRPSPYQLFDILQHIQDNFVKLVILVQLHQRSIILLLINQIILFLSLQVALLEILMECRSFLLFHQ